MARKKWYYVLLALVIVMVFGTAAICNMCGASAATTDKTGTDEETVAASTAKSTDSTTEKDGKDSSTESTAKTSDSKASDSSSESPTATETTAEDTEAPIIKLEIYEGPTYSAADDICYYRVQAKVTGKPTPVIKFSKDDSLGNFGKNKAQVNLNDPGDTYTLTATATNSEGTDEDSIEISWRGCPISEPEPIQEDISIDVDKNKSGYIIVDMGAYTGDTSVYTFVGDYTNDKQIKAYLSFDIEDISDLDDVTIKDASLSMPVDAIIAHPELMPEVHVRVFDYGSTLELADQGAGGEFVKVFPATAPMENFNFSGSDLEAALQDAIDAGDNRFQLKFSLSGINADGVGDWYRFILGDIELNIVYEIPG